MRMKVLLTVTTYPLPSKTYDELACTARTMPMHRRAWNVVRSPNGGDTALEEGGLTDTRALWRT